MKKVFVIVAVVLACSLILGVLVRLGGSASHVVGPSIFGGGSNDPEDIGGAGELLYISDVAYSGSAVLSEESGIYTLTISDFYVPDSGNAYVYQSLGTFNFLTPDPMDISVGFYDMAIKTHDLHWNGGGGEINPAEWDPFDHNGFYDFSLYWNKMPECCGMFLSPYSDVAYWGTITSDQLEAQDSFDFVLSMSFDSAFEVACFIMGTSPDDPMFDSSSDSYDPAAHYGIQSLISQIEEGTDQNFGGNVSFEFRFYVWVGSEFVEPPED